jgi:hypothetical protein
MTLPSRRQMRLQILNEYGGNVEVAARTAVFRGLYAKSTNLGDVIAAFAKTWITRNRKLER